MAKTSVDARRHVRELGKFFGDANVIAEAMVNEFIKARKKKKYLKQSLERFVEKGLVVRREGNFFIMRKGAVFFRRIAVKEDLRNIKSWDGKWRLVTFDVPVSADEKRYQLRRLLKEFGFYQLQKSVWIYPNHLAEKFWRLLVDVELDRYCKVMLVEFLEGDENVRRHFRQVIKSR